MARAYLNEWWCELHRGVHVLVRDLETLRFFLFSRNVLPVLSPNGFYPRGQLFARTSALSLYRLDHGMDVLIVVCSVRAPHIEPSIERPTHIAAKKLWSPTTESTEARYALRTVVMLEHAVCLGKCHERKCVFCQSSGEK